MRKFKYKKSANEEALQPIVKVVQENSEDKHYYDKSKHGLINYLKSEAKEGKVKLFENGKVEEEDGLKHIIISPCKVSSWERMTSQEKLQIRTSFISKLESDFKDKNYLLAVEEKSRKNDDGKDILMEHYHLVVSNKTPTDKKFKVNYKKALMTNYIENFTSKDTREKLGIKTFNEIKEQKILKMKNFYENKKDSILKKNEINTLYGVSRGIFEDKKDSFSFNRTQKYYILKEKKNLLTDISSIKKSIGKTLTHIQTINDSIKNISFYKNSLTKQYSKELSTYRNHCFKSLKDFTLYSKYEHRFFTKLQKQKLNDGTINQERFLTSIARSKSYWKSEEVHKRRTIENELLHRQEIINKQIKNLEFEIHSLLENKEQQNLINKHLESKINIKKYLLANNRINKLTNEELFSNKLKIYEQYFSFINQDIKSKKQDLKTSQNYEPKTLK